jgi:hypothetical protein
MKVSANMLVATAARGSMWNWNIAGTVMRDVLPVTTLRALVRKKIRMRKNSGAPVIVVMSSMIDR